LSFSKRLSSHLTCACDRARQERVDYCSGVCSERHHRPPVPHPPVYLCTNPQIPVSFVQNLDRSLPNTPRLTQSSMSRHRVLNDTYSLQHTRDKSPRLQPLRDRQATWHCRPGGFIAGIFYCFASIFVIFPGNRPTRDGAFIALVPGTLELGGPLCVSSLVESCSLGVARSRPSASQRHSPAQVDRPIRSSRQTYWTLGKSKAK